MAKRTDNTIGVDISKAHPDVHRLSDGVAARFGNDQSGLRALIAWLGKGKVSRIVYEPTGPYHRRFEEALEQRFGLVKVNPLQARRFAQARGTRAKTDAIDARMLAKMGEPFDWSRINDRMETNAHSKSCSSHELHSLRIRRAFATD